MTTLKGKTVIVTGGSRGIGRAIALACAKDGANVVLAAKTTESTGKRKGTIFDVAKEVEQAGGKALPLQVDVREEERLAWMVDQTVAKFGAIDILVNNAGALVPSPVESVPLRRFDLMVGINLRAALYASQLCIPHLKKSANGHILNLSPPIDLDPQWFRGYAPYTITKYGLSMLTIGLAEELRGNGIAVNSLWPRTVIATAAIEVFGGDTMIQASRTAEIMGDAARAIFLRTAAQGTGLHLIDEDVLREAGVKDFAKYSVTPGAKLLNDLYVKG